MIVSSVKLPYVCSAGADEHSANHACRPETNVCRVCLPLNKASLAVTLEEMPSGFSKKKKKKRNCGWPRNLQDG